LIPFLFITLQFIYPNTALIFWLTFPGVLLHFCPPTYTQICCPLSLHGVWIL
jgi:hypothetical protein